MDLSQLEDKELVSSTVLDNGYMLLTYNDGTTALVKVASINDEGVLKDALNTEDEETDDDEEEDEEDDDEETDDDAEDSDDEELTWEDIDGSDFEELEDIIDDNDLDIDIDDYEDKKKSVNKLKKKIAKELDIEVG